MTLIILGVIVACGHFRFGSLAAALSAMSGDPLRVEEPLLSMDMIRPGSRVTLRYILTNASSRPIEIIGMSSSCSCTLMEGLPATLAASETRSVTATVSTREGQSSLDGSIRLFTNHPNAAELVLGYRIRMARASQQVSAKETNYPGP